MLVQTNEYSMISDCLILGRQDYEKFKARDKEAVGTKQAQLLLSRVPLERSADPEYEQYLHQQHHHDTVCDIDLQVTREERL